MFITKQTFHIQVYSPYRLRFIILPRWCDGRTNRNGGVNQNPTGAVWNCLYGDVYRATKGTHIIECSIWVNLYYFLSLLYLRATVSVPSLVAFPGSPFCNSFSLEFAFARILSLSLLCQNSDSANDDKRVTNEGQIVLENMR